VLIALMLRYVFLMYEQKAPLAVVS